MLSSERYTMGLRERGWRARADELAGLPEVKFALDRRPHLVSPSLITRGANASAWRSR